MSQTPTTDYRLGFESLEEQTAVDSLPVTGTVPTWLAGSLIRVTPAQLEVGGRRLAHWFDGLAMLNRFGIADGRVSYKSRFIDSIAADGPRRPLKWSSSHTGPAITVIASAAKMPPINSANSAARIDSSPPRMTRIDAASPASPAPHASASPIRSMLVR